MRPLRKGAARTGLTENLTELRQHQPLLTDPQVAAVIGGAATQTLADMGHDKGEQEVFFRMFNENMWRLTRALRASGTLHNIE